MPRIRVLAGVSPSALEPISANLPPSSPQYKIKTDTFEGELAVFLKGFVNEHGERLETEYFDKDREGITWSIQARGRFLKEYSADDILFGNVFDRSLNLPTGSSIALRFMKTVDPTLEHDLQGDKPWAVSPLISTMPYLSHTRQDPSSPLPHFSTATHITNDSSLLIPSDATAKHDRRAYFTDRAHRRALTLGPSDIISVDFCQGYLTFDPTLALTLPVGFSINLERYWDGRPICYVCCERGDGDGPGKVIWCVAFDLVQEDELNEAEDQEEEEEEEKHSGGQDELDEVD